MTKPYVHLFSSTGEAYDACQCDVVTDGDLLLVESERVVGVAGTWPVAVTKNHGELHVLKPDAPRPVGWADAVALALKLGYEVRDA